MKITAATVSVLFAAFTPAVVGQWLPEGTLAVVTFQTNDGTGVTVPASETCEPSPFGEPFVAEVIDIDNKVPHVKCAFYDGEDCEGQDYTLKEGLHQFTREFVVGSFKCAAVEE
ncbi:hypothetical protein ASPSYDRAFT_92998 [Aspergillus sydowii CBS 593.65]|uniref:Uncharacterized protein n=1 Tax=Aspergillus sydowii CBS 593.65 TaxID=1036612 RepID=A0A1L9T693_9EURO|nr:uncharacterized protein ASPSYDRAFT_92998 [Aspergillus sydowii CBS 593.65]OJJ54964.1 hypothetical protein ASPSYDRAFT_92998 [Aspergillus sydowii CBS 593.65]